MAPSWPGVPVLEGGFAKLMRIGPAPGKISFPFMVALAAIALSTRSKFTNPQLLWVKTRADTMGPYDLNISVRVDVVVEVGMLPSHNALVGPSKPCSSAPSRPLLRLLDRPRDIPATACGRSSKAFSSGIWISAAVKELSSLDGVGR